MNRLALAALFLSTLTACAQSLQQRIEAIAKEPAVARAHWGVHVTTLDGKPLAAVNEGQLFQPASNTKLFTTAAAMALLKVDERVHTTVETNDDAVGGVVHSLRLIGAGDANLSSRTLPYAPPAPEKSGATPPPQPDELRYLDELAAKVKAAGITRVEGDVIGVDPFYWDPYPPDWSIDDAVWYYGAPVTGLMIADNALTMTVTPAAALLTKSAPATVTLEPGLNYYTIDSRVMTSAAGSASDIHIDRAIGERVLHLRGQIASDAKPYVQPVSIDDPVEYAALALREALVRQGITVYGHAVASHRAVRDASPGDTVVLANVTTPTRVLASHESAPLYDDIVVINKVSQNQHAELLLRRIASARGLATTAHGTEVVRGFLTQQAGVNGDDFIFFDGSGLSGHNLVTPRAITQLLRYGASQPWGERWKASLPVGGVDGGLRTRFADPLLKNHVFAKTGTLGEARALSGYLQCASGRTVVFSVMVSAHTPLNDEDRKAMDRMVAAIAQAE